MSRGGLNLERLYFVDDPALDVERTCLGEDVFVRSIKRYEYAARHVARGDAVADCACGSGYGSRILKAAGASRVVGVDSDPVTVEYARRHYGEEQVVFDCQDIDRLVLPAASFDVVASIETIEHITDGRGFLSRVYEVLRPGGRAVISTPLALRSGPNEANPYHLHEYTRTDFERLVRDIFDSAEFFVPTPADMPLALTDGNTVGLVFGVGYRK
jgi:2-polyprenyl-3-methyl-5-hydroxy-6-metoxy-1,4-benzoquinol methylase